VAALLTMFAVLRKVYGTLPSVLALMVICVDPQLLLQSQQARFHTLFVAEAAVAILLLQRLITQPTPPYWLLILNTVIHACMMLTSYIAIFYSPALLGAVLIVSLVRRRNPLRLSLSIIAAWVVILPWIPVMLRHIEMSKLGWIPVATPQMLRAYFENYLTPQFRWFALILVEMFGVSLLATFCFGGRHRRDGFRRGERSLLAMAASFLAVPFVLYLISSRPGANSLFHERYMIPTLLGWAIVLAHCAHRAFLARHRNSLRALTVVLVGLQVILTLNFVARNVRRIVREARHYGPELFENDLAAQLPGQEPIVVEHIHEFMSWHYYSPVKTRYRFLLDPEVGRKEMSGGPMNHAIMGALQRHFPERFQEVETTENFLRHASSFYVRHSPGYQWYPMRLQSNPNFVVEEMPGDLLRVRRAAP
jgi:hypothetical protein